jgi:peroxiredoxin
VLQLRHLVELEKELAVAYTRVIAISTDAWRENAALRIGIGAQFSILSDADRVAQREMGLVEVTSRNSVNLPRDFVLYPDLTIYKVYNGYYFWGRATNEDLRQDFRALSALVRKDWDPTALDAEGALAANKEFNWAGAKPETHGRPV